MTAAVDQGRAAIAAGLVGSEWLDLPDLVRGAAVEFVEVLLEAEACTDFDSAAFDAAEVVCPIYYTEQLAMLTDPVMCQWLDGVDTGYRPEDTVSITQAACDMVTVAFVSGIGAMFAGMAEELRNGDGLRLFGLSSAEIETALGLWDEWEGTVAELLDAARALEEVGR